MKDAVKHAFVSFLGTLVISIVTLLLMENKEIGIYISGAIMLLIGVLKEVVWDWLMKKGVPSYADVTADAMGVGVAMMVLLMIFVK